MQWKIPKEPKRSKATGVCALFHLDRLVPSGPYSAFGFCQRNVPSLFGFTRKGHISKNQENLMFYLGRRFAQTNQDSQRGFQETKSCEEIHINCPKIMLKREPRHNSLFTVNFVLFPTRLSFSWTGSRLVLITGGFPNLEPGSTQNEDIRIKIRKWLSAESWRASRSFRGRGGVRNGRPHFLETGSAFETWAAFCKREYTYTGKRAQRRVRWNRNKAGACKG